MEEKDIFNTEEEQTLENLEENPEEISEVQDAEETLEEIEEIRVEREPMKKSTKIAIVIVSAAALLLVVLSIVLSCIFGSSYTAIGYVGNKSWDSWSGTYKFLDGELKHTVHSDSGKLYINVKTVKGSIDIEITDANGNEIFDRENIGNESFTLDVSGKVYIEIDAEDHEGSFVIGD